MNDKPRTPAWLAAVAGAVAFAAILWAEHRDSLRKPTEPKGRRVVRNLAVAGVSAIAIQLAEQPIIRPLTELVDRRKLGMVKRLALPELVEVLLAIVLLDYTLYWWHLIEHRVPALWRFHRVHHADLDLDASTALRFHFGELMASIPWRTAQVVVIGVSPRSYSLWQRALLASITFHHSNIRLPISVERWLSRIIVTPRLHGIHHSIVPSETNSNWSSGLMVWDYLHHTDLLNVPQRDIAIGIPAYREPEEVAFAALLEMPFGAQPPIGHLPDGSVPVRAPSGVPRDFLLP